MSLVVLGAGAFGTSLAIALAQDGTEVMLWGRNAAEMENMQRSRQSTRRLPGHRLPDSVFAFSDLGRISTGTVLLAVPMQSLAAFIKELPEFDAALVACCKGIDLKTGLGPVSTIQRRFTSSVTGILTGPSFAQDIASGLPTALVLACQDDASGKALQDVLSRPMLRIYRTADVSGAELGGALKNVIALAAGMTHGAGLGDSARASVIARGFAEMTRYATAKGALVETLHGLSGLGDLVLTCTSEKSRNFSAGVAMGRGENPPEKTIEGLATSSAVAEDAHRLGLDLPLIKTVSQVVAGELDIPTAVATLLARPVGKE